MNRSPRLRGLPRNSLTPIKLRNPVSPAVQCLMSFRPPSLKMPAEGTAHDPMHMVATVGTCYDSPVKMATTGWNINTHQTSKQQNKTKQKKEKQHKPTTPKPTQQSASLCPTWPFTRDWHPSLTHLSRDGRSALSWRILSSSNSE